MPARAARVSNGKACLTLPCSVSRTARRNAAAGENGTSRRSRTDIGLTSLPCAGEVKLLVSRFAHPLSANRQDAAQQILQDRSLADLDVGSYRHARRRMEVRRHTVQVHPIDRYARPVVQVRSEE